MSRQAMIDDLTKTLLDMRDRSRKQNSIWVPVDAAPAPEHLRKPSTPQTTQTQEPPQTQETTEAKSFRRALLEEAIDLVDNIRNRAYGAPRFNHNAAADLKATFWNHFNSACARSEDGKQKSVKLGRDTPHGESIDLLLTKLGRIATGQFKPDNYADIAGYVANAYECAMDVA